MICEFLCNFHFSIKFVSNSVADDECYPYDAVVGRCRATKSTNLKDLGCSIPDFRQTENLYKMGPAYSLFNETDIMYEIKNYGPVQGEMTLICVLNNDD